MVDSVGVLAMRDTNLQPLPLGTPQDLETVDRRVRALPQRLVAADVVADPQPRVELSVQAGAEREVGPLRVSDRQRERRDHQQRHLHRTRASRGAGGTAVQPAARVPAGHERRRQQVLPDRLVEPRSAARRHLESARPDGWLGKIFRQDKSVLRGGYGLVFDRTNSVQHIFALGMGYGENLAVLAPRCNVNGTPGAGCNAGGRRTERCLPRRRRWSDPDSAASGGHRADRAGHARRDGVRRLRRSRPGGRTASTSAISASSRRA